MTASPLPNIPVRNLFSPTSVAGPQVNATAVGGKGRAGGQASLQSGKAGKTALNNTLALVKKATPTVAKTNGLNFDSSMAFNTQLTQGISSFQSSLGSGNQPSFTLPSNAFSANGSESMFDFAKASEALKGSTFDYNTNLLGDTQTAKGGITQANNLGKETLGALNEVAGELPGALGKIAQGGIQIGTGIPMTTNPVTAIAGWGLVAAGTIGITTGLTDGSQSRNKASQAQEDTAPQAEQAYQAAAQKMATINDNNEAMQELYQGLNAQAFPALNRAQQGVKGLNDLLAQIDPSANAGLLNGSGAPTPTASAPVDTSWNTPATPTPPTTASASSMGPVGASSTTASTWPTTSPDQTTAPTANSPEDSQLAKKRQFVEAFKGQQGNGNQATDLAQGLIAQAPPNFNREALGSLAVKDAGQTPPLTQAYEQFKAEIEAQKNGGNQANAMMPPANPMAQAGGEGANGQAVAGNAPNGAQTAQNPQGSVANAPVATAQGQPAPTSVATAPAVADASWGASAPPTANGLTIPGHPVAKALATPAPTATLGSFA
jgi:hypothetical protein